MRFHAEKLLGIGIRFVGITCVISVHVRGIDHHRTVSGDDASLTRDVFAIGSGNLVGRAIRSGNCATGNDALIVGFYAKDGQFGRR